ncbi:MAG: methyltransferase family protein [Candidatus Heimdallarchaeaceae archaeon]
MIDSTWYWIVIGILSVILVIWIIFAIYRGIRFEAILAFGYVFLILGMSFTLGEYLPIPYYQNIAGSLTLLGMLLVILGLLCSQRRWVKRKGTKNLNSFKNLLVFAYIRHPMVLGTVILCFALITLANSILSNVFAVLAVICFFLASYEKDSYMVEKYGYPYKVYALKVPRFNIIWGIIKAIKTNTQGKGDKKKKEILYE